MIGRRDFNFSASFTYLHTQASLLIFFVCFFILFQFCCSHERVFGKTLLNELHTSYSHTEWYLLFTRKAMPWSCRSTWSNDSQSMAEVLAYLHVQVSPTSYSSHCLDKTLTQQLSATGGRGLGDTTACTDNFCKKSPISGAWLGSSDLWGFRISLSLIKFTLKKRINKQINGRLSPVKKEL